ncbi:MAG: DUF362 domain-containing protein, partial [Ignavibacteriae bacterium]|nr:DUF362 domain-containing protein [Ignavibacteriota bacterium]
MKLPEPKSPTKVTNLPSADPTVAVVSTTPATVLEDIQRTMELAGLKKALSLSAPTILKDNISWHFPFPGANTTPWQMEGTIQGLRNSGYKDITCVQNMTVVT